MLNLLTQGRALTPTQYNRTVDSAGASGSAIRRFGDREIKRKKDKSLKGVSY